MARPPKTGGQYLVASSDSLNSHPMRCHWAMHYYLSSTLKSQRLIINS